MHAHNDVQKSGNIFSFYNKKQKHTSVELTKKLVAAITMTQEEKAIALINAGANLHYIDEKGELFSVLALTFMAPTFNRTIAEKLLNVGANPNEAANNKIQQPCYSSLPNFSIWQLAAISGRKEVVEFLKEKCVHLSLEITSSPIFMGDLTIIDFLKPHKNPNVQAIYNKTLEEMDNKLRPLYGMDPLKMEDSIIKLMEAYEEKHAASSIHEKKIAKKNIKSILEEAPQEGNLKLSDLCMLDNPMKSTFLFGMRLQKTMRQLLNGNSALHIEIANLIMQKPGKQYKF